MCHCYAGTGPTSTHTLLGRYLITLSGLRATLFALACITLTTRTIKPGIQKPQHIGSRKYWNGRMPPKWDDVSSSEVYVSTYIMLQLLLVFFCFFVGGQICIKYMYIINWWIDNECKIEVFWHHYVGFESLRFQDCMLF